MNTPMCMTTTIAMTTPQAIRPVNRIRIGITMHRCGISTRTTPIFTIDTTTIKDLIRFVKLRLNLVGPAT